MKLVEMVKKCANSIKMRHYHGGNSARIVKVRGKKLRDAQFNQIGQKVCPEIYSEKREVSEVHQSRPMPLSYTKPMEVHLRPFKESLGNPTPSIMQDAFIRAVLKG
jgi:hypothetical protein